MAAAKGDGEGLEFDKDDQIAMNFVAAASNLRSRVFQVLQSQYCTCVLSMYCVIRLFVYKYQYIIPSIIIIRITSMLFYVESMFG